MADSAALLVDEVLPHKPMRQWVLSVPFPLRFLLASQPDVMARVLAIVHRAIATHLTHKAGYTKISAQTGAVTLIQRFGGALNLNIHFHMLFLDGVYCRHGMRFHRVKAPSGSELTRLTHTIARRIGRSRTSLCFAAPGHPAHWAKRLKRVFNIDIETCSKCGGDVRIIACIEDPAVIRKILAHLDAVVVSTRTRVLPHCRAPPAQGLLV